MRRIVFAGLSTITALVLLFSYHTSTNRTGSIAVAVPATDTDGAADEAAGTPTDEASTTESSTAESSTESATESSNGSSDESSDESAQTFTGGVAETRWGPVQVEITVEGGRITAADAVQYPTGHESDEINAYAVPVLNQSAVSVQSSDIEIISGATITSEGYQASLQSAIDAAAAAGVTVGA